MPRPRKPTKVLELNGAFRKNPSRGRAREDEPIVLDPIGAPPASFLNAASSTQIELLAIWHELIAQVPDGVLTSADRFHLEMTCRLQYKVRHGSASTGEFAQLNKCLGQMGLNPADRSKVSGNGKNRAAKGSASEWEEYASKTRPARAS